jgi:hypothetical protein
MAKWDKWPEKITTGEHTAQLLDYVVKKTDKRVMLVLAIGGNGIAVAKDQKLEPEAAIAMLESERQLISDLIESIHAGFERTKREFGHTRRAGPS